MVFYDLGYLGVEKDYPDQISILPYKKIQEKKGKTINHISKKMEQITIQNQN